MRDQDADLHLEAVEDVLDETIGLLERYGEDQWAAWPRTSRRRLAAGDAYGLDHLLQAFGGMGSFNDLALMRANGAPDPSGPGGGGQRPLGEASKRHLDRGDRVASGAAIQPVTTRTRDPCS
jgi:Domain of unknown function (DUF6966)